MNKFNKEIQKRVDAALKVVFKDADYHFKQDGWDLDYRGLEDDVIYYSLGNLKRYIFNKLSNRYEYHYSKDHGGLLKPKKPIKKKRK